MLHERRRLRLSRAFAGENRDGLADAWLDALRHGQDPSEAAPDVLQDDWNELAFSALQAWKNKKQGSIYAAAYLLHDKVYKLGKTAAEPSARVLKLKTAGVLAPLVLVHCCAVPDRHAAEALLHRRFAQQRVEREFFQVDYAAVVREMNRIAQAEWRLWALALRKTERAEP